MNANASSWAETKRRKTFELFYWTLAWLLTYALATFGPKLLWQSEALSVLAIVLNAVIGVGVILANARHLRNVDELERKITVEAMSVTLGVGFVAGFSYTLLDEAGLMAFAAKPHHLLTLMALVLMAAVLIGVWRHK